MARNSDTPRKEGIGSPKGRPGSSQNRAAAPQKKADTSNLLDYLTTHTASFADEPFNEVDGLVLSAVSYFNFEQGLVARKQSSEHVPLSMALCGIPYTKLYSAEWLAYLEHGLIAAVLQSPRFMELEIAYFANESSSHFEKQFSAVSFFFPDNTVFVAFRGTDNSLAGWKEDFNLNFMEQVPSQTRARSYLEDIAALEPNRLLVGGHSKGGNLAEYAALTCTQSTFDRLGHIYNYDGPGFAFPPSARITDAAYEQKLSKFVPESSVVGMLLEQRTNFTIVGAQGLLLMQHVPTHWTIKDNHFVEKEALSADAQLVSKTLNSWAATYDTDQIELLINTMYGVIGATNAESLTEISANKKASMMAVIDAARKLPDDKRRTVMAMLADVAPILGNEAAGMVRDALSNVIP